MDKKKQIQIELTEMFCAMADKERCFFGIIKRWTDNDGNPKVFSKIVMPDDGYISAQADDQKVLGTMLDGICILALNKGIHDDSGKSIKIFDVDFFLN